MGEYLRSRLKQQRFSSVYQEAFLSLLVAADALQRRVSELCEAHGITHPQYNVLRILRGVYPGGHPRCEIIDRMVHVSPDVTRLINRLEASGLVVRGKSDDDKRLSLTYITQSGLDLLERMRPDVESIEAEMAAKISQQDASTLTNICESIARD